MKRAGITGEGAAMAMVGNRVAAMVELRDGTTGRIATVMPRIWAVRARGGSVRRFTRCGAGAAALASATTMTNATAAASVEDEAVEQRRKGPRGAEAHRGAMGPVFIGPLRMGTLLIAPVLMAAAEAAVAEELPVAPMRSEQGVEVAFYRKYTEGMLRRYGVLSMEAGRVPSLLGREMFRGHVTSYRVRSFEDVVIFCHDVENCVKRLSEAEQQLLKRIALQEYTHAEAAGMLGLSLRSCIRQYAAAVDRLTAIFLKERMLEPLKNLAR